MKISLHWLKQKKEKGKVCFCATKRSFNRPAMSKKAEAKNDNLKLCKMCFYCYKNENPIALVEEKNAFLEFT
jgi:hypothetical protein